MAPVARELARHRGVLEPIQTATSLQGQVDELREAIDDFPCALVGYSWGAWLSALVAADHPALVEKLILVSSGPFEERYVDQLRATRMARLDEKDRRDFDRRFAELCSKTDSFDPLPEEPVAFDARIYAAVWPEGAALRKSGALLERVAELQCPVVAIQGDYDPHPSEGVERPLARTLRDFRFILLDRCGHTPWIERHARERFFEILEREIN